MSRRPIVWPTKCCIWLTSWAGCRRRHVPSGSVSAAAHIGGETPCPSSTPSARQLAPVNPEGYPFIGGFALASLILFWLWPPLGWIGCVLTLWCAYFFRDPPRVTPLVDGLVVSPADGRVSRIVNAVPPPELALGERRRCRASRFS